MQPYRKFGRFYNDAQDSILRRLVVFCVLIVPHIIYYFLSCISRSRRKSYKEHVLNYNELWVTNTPPDKQSLNLSITWLGHSTFLIQFNNTNLLLDPILFDQHPFFIRRTKFPFEIGHLPAIDYVITSHRHNDHMDEKSMKFLSKKSNVKCLVPIGDKRLCKKYGFSEIEEFNWWQSMRCFCSDGETAFMVTFLPAIHWASRGVFDINTSLWGSWLIETGKNSIYFAGDTGYGKHFKEIATRMLPIDVALLPIAPDKPRESHINCCDAIEAFIDLKAKHFIPMHWGSFWKKGREQFDEPIYKLKTEWEKKTTTFNEKALHLPKSGEVIRFDDLYPH